MLAIYCYLLRTLSNIATLEHGVELFESRRTDNLQTICVGHMLSAVFEQWHLEQTPENRAKFLDKLKLACAREFAGGEPLFKTLNNADGIREIRFDAYPGGAIRILFKKIGEKQAILTGFIKKRRDEGYKQEIAVAKELNKQFG